MPFLDTDPQRSWAAPFYAAQSDNDLSTPTLTMHDRPWYDGQEYEGDKWKKMALTENWSNYIVFDTDEHNELVIYPLFLSTWTVTWGFSGYVVGSGVTNKTGSQTSSEDYVETHHFGTGQQTSLNWANDVWALVGP